MLKPTQKPRPVPIEGVEQPQTAGTAVFESDMGRERNQIATVIMDLLNAFSKEGKHSNLMAQSSNGKQFQERFPLVRRYSRQHTRKLSCIEIKVGMLPTISPDLGPGFEFKPTKVRSIIQRVVGNVPVEILVSGRSSEESALYTWAVKQIFNSYVFRLYRGLIFNKAENWQIGFPRTVEFSGMQDAEDISGEDNLGGVFYMATASFDIMYESVFVEKAEKEQAKVLVKTEPSLILVPQNFNPVGVNKGDRLLILLDTNEHLSKAEIVPERAAILLPNLDKKAVEIFINGSTTFKLVITSSTLTRELEIHVN
ncbi:hypothetical protein [Ewingella americana]|uniref:Uncharacterized protein n=1 Tax=Ewingella americana TaxID=41202 RepID=A0A502GGH8_9GAMM|nr:hypothetical protein [Ewingella americana]TPG60066.1 hypothetical protein EAH77_15985 [Ewingella americana]